VSRFRVMLPLLVGVCPAILVAGEPAPRVQTLLTQWQFAEEPAGAMRPPDQGWKPVTVPHVFRQSGLPDDTAGWYRRVFRLSRADRARRFQLHLEGAASVKDVYVNGRHLGQHRGPFSACTFELTPALRFGGANTLEVRVTNREADTRNCFARSTLYYVNGGMFRKAWLVSTGPVHLAPELGATGVYFTPLRLSEREGRLEASTRVVNDLGKAADVVVRHRVSAPGGGAGPFLESRIRLQPGETGTAAASAAISDLKSWDIRRPSLYTVRTEVWCGGRCRDAVTTRVGFRTIAWKEGRFLLNGREIRFRGVNKHAQTEASWNAVSDADLRREWQGMDALGANLVRLAHYPHASLEYDEADARGIAVWAENGYAGQVWKDPGNEERTVTPDGERLTREMVRQNWNHPSILFWSAGNETILDVVSHYAGILRDEKDPNRLVTYAANDKAPRNCDFVANNTYDGWYTDGPYTDFSRSARNALVSETGSGDWVTHHVPYGALTWSVDHFEPEEYSEIFTEYRLQTVCRVAPAAHPMFLWWNYREFYNLKFKKNRNTKGLLTLAGAPKDTSFLFRAFLAPDTPVLHLCGRNHLFRGVSAGNGIKAYANGARLTLRVNGQPAGTRNNGDYRIPDGVQEGPDGKPLAVPGIPVANVFFWQGVLRPGRNDVEVRDEAGREDRMVVYAAGGALEPGAPLRDLASSNPGNPVLYLGAPAMAQGPVYRDVDGASDNTFDELPRELLAGGRLLTRRLSDPALRTDLAFTPTREATVSLLFSTGLFPAFTLRPPDAAIRDAAQRMRAAVRARGFRPLPTPLRWRDHDLNLAFAEAWTRRFGPGERVEIPGETLDYVVLIR
jgi:beta-galactosidase